VAASRAPAATRLRPARHGAPLAAERRAPV